MVQRGCLAAPLSPAGPDSAWKRPGLGSQEQRAQAGEGQLDAALQNCPFPGVNRIESRNLLASCPDLWEEAGGLAKHLSVSTCRVFPHS